MGIKILPTRKFFDEDISYLKSKLHADCQILEPKSFDEPELLNYAQEADVFLGPVISKELCKAAPKLKFIQIPWTGVDNLNFQLIEEVGVTVCNSHSNAYAVAEHAVALMLDVAKKITYHDSEFRNGNWNRPRPDGSNEVSPFSKRISNSDVGIIGFGHIGRNIYDFLQGFKCKFHIADATVNEIHSKNGIIFYPPQLITEFLPCLDYLFISVPLTESTKGFVNEEFLKELQNTAVLINISRGEVINEDALFVALANKRLLGAGIDTWYNYPKNPNEPTFPSSRNPFHELKNLVMSPHRSAFIAGELPHLDDAALNINRAAEGLDPINIISTQNKY